MNSINQHYYGTAQRRRKARRSREKSLEISLTEAEGTETSGSVIGYWMIPIAESYVKLKIYDSYSLSMRSGFLWLGKTKKVVNNFFGQALCPVWALVLNKALLEGYFPRLAQDLEPLEDLEDESQWTSAAKKVIRGVMSQGWSFFIIQSGEGYLGCQQGVPPQYVGILMNELFKGQMELPTDVAVDASGIAYINLINEDGRRKRKVDVKDLVDVKVGVDSNLEEYLKAYSEHGVDVFTSGSFADLVAALSPQSVDNFISVSPKSYQPMVAMLMTSWFEYAAAKNINHAGLDSYSSEYQKIHAEFLQQNPDKAHLAKQAALQAMLQESGDIKPLTEGKVNLLELNFAKLIKLTQKNGGYKVGGMKKVGNHWVNDVTVPGRIANAKFVITQPPQVDVVEDGGIIYRYRFRSVNDRSTTGQDALGYVRLFPRQKGAWGWIKSYLKGNGPWQADCHAWCNCFSGDAMVTMEDGTRKAISAIRTGDRVITHKGRARTVTHTLSREVTQEESLYNLSTQSGFGECIVTGEHPIMVLRGNDKCLCGCGEELGYNNHHTLSPPTMLERKCIQGHGGRKLSETDLSGGYWKWVKTDDFRAREWGLSPWKEAGDHKVPNVLAFFLGLYVADGHIPRRLGRVGSILRISVHLDDTILQNNIIEMANQHDLPYSVYKRKKGHNWVDIAIRDRDFVLKIFHLCTGKALTKRVALEVMHWHPESLKVLIAAMWAGDGTVSPGGRIIYFTTSVDLRNQLQVLLDKCGIRNTASIHRARKKQRVTYSKRDKKYTLLSTSPTYQISIHPEEEIVDLICKFKGRDRPKASKRERATYEHESGQTRVLTLKPTKWHGTVYDLTVEEDHSFLVDGIVVSNCPDFVYRWHWALANKKASHKPTGQNGDAINSPPDETNPEYKLSLCKHLTALSPFLLDPPRSVKKTIADLRDQAMRNRGVDPEEEQGEPQEELPDSISELPEEEI